MRSSFLIFASALSLSAVVAFAGEARADETTAQPAAQPAGMTAPPTKESPEKEGGDDDLKRFALEINPLGITIGRYSVSGEYLFAKHHAVTLNPFFAHVPVTVSVNGSDIDAGSLTGFGGELGYRFYTGSKGANGFYVGPSVLFASYSTSTPDGSSAGSSSSNSFTSVGGAIDIGGQAIIGPGVIVGGGFGLQYTTTSEEFDTDNFNLASAVIASGGVRPRFLLSAGYAF